MNSFLDIVNKRFSCRAYKSDHVPREMIEKIIEATRLAPSACNKQPWRLAVVTDPAMRGELASDGILPGIGMDWIKDAPVILVLGIRKSFVTHQVVPTISGVDYPLLDLGIAGEHAVLQAAELGLGTCWIGWIRQEPIRKIVDWPKDIIPQAMITLGWPAEQPVQKTTRLPASETVKWCE